MTDYYVKPQDDSKDEALPNAWLSGLASKGILISPVVLDDWYPNGPLQVTDYDRDQLRRKYGAYCNGDIELRDWLHYVFDSFLGHHKPVWHRPATDDAFKSKHGRPDWVLLNAGRLHAPYFGVFIATDLETDKDDNPAYLKGKKAKDHYARVLRIQEDTGMRLGIQTNGHVIRLIYNGLDSDSYIEWRVEDWFGGQDGREALHGFTSLLGRRVLTHEPQDDAKNLLLDRVEESRDRQGDLSHVMSNQVREAVELILEDFNTSLHDHNESTRTSILQPLHNLASDERGQLNALYQSAIRIVMRLVVTLYAEQRGLLPRHQEIYYESYSIDGLYDGLQRSIIDGQEEVLETKDSAWQRIQALFQVIYHGTHHGALEINGFGGKLFETTVEASNHEDPVLAALDCLADQRITLTDATWYKVLRKLKVGKFKVGGKWITGPVDFSDLRTEFIGMMYEGLLDYDLRVATEEDGGIIFLNVGDQPALPFNVLKSLTEKQIKGLWKDSKDKAKSSVETTEEGDEEVAEILEHEEDTSWEGQVHAWALKVVQATATPSENSKWKKLDEGERRTALNKKAREIIYKAIRPGEYYLVSWNGARKGTGTFYTKPGLAIPTVMRTLRPLAYEQVNEEWVPRRPEEILALKVCDPAMGSGSFPVAALRYLSKALAESIEHHILTKKEFGPISLEVPDKDEDRDPLGYLCTRVLDIHQKAEEDWRDRLEAKVKRLVAEHCIYGVDINGLAVELGKLALWIETMDPTARFTFLDHKIKHGNSLVSARFEDLRVVPPLRKRKFPPEHKEEGTKYETTLRALHAQSQTATAPLSSSRQVRRQIENCLIDTANGLSRVHGAPDERRRESLYQALIQSKAYGFARAAFNQQCLAWFASPEEMTGISPRLVDGGEADMSAIQAFAARVNPFHWELEFADVFLRDSPGFNAVIGNPPWEMVSVLEVRFLSRHYSNFSILAPVERDSLTKHARDTGNQVGVELVQADEDTAALANWLRHHPSPATGDCVEGKPSLDAAFANLANSLLAHGGRAGLILHSRCKGDRGYNQWRRRIVHYGGFDMVVGFLNAKRWAFDIHPDTTFAIVVWGEQPGQEVIAQDYCTNSKVMQDPPEAITSAAYAAAVDSTLPAIDSPAVAQVLAGLSARHPTLRQAIESGEVIVAFDGDVSKWTRAKLAWALPENSPKGHLRDTPDGCLPVIEPAQFTQYCEGYASWVKRFGRASLWQQNAHPTTEHGGHRYVISDSETSFQAHTRQPTLRYIETTGALNRWPLVATYISKGVGMQGTPSVRDKHRRADVELGLLAVMNSIVANAFVRRRMTNNHIPKHILEKLPVPSSILESPSAAIINLSAALALNSEPLRQFRSGLVQAGTIDASVEPGLITPNERLVGRAILEAHVALEFGLSASDMQILLCSSVEPRLTFAREANESGGSGLPNLVLGILRAHEAGAPTISPLRIETTMEINQRLQEIINLSVAFPTPEDESLLQSDELVREAT